jgi:hypothetical protein
MHCALVRKLFALPLQPPYVKVSHWLESGLKWKRRIEALQGPVWGGSEHGARLESAKLMSILGGTSGMGLQVQDWHPCSSFS